MRHVPLTADDEELTVRLECDPEMMRSIPAYPAMTNTASNRVAQKIGIENQGAFDNESFAGVLRCNDWCIDLS
jgi:hypothetical protein